MRLRPWTDEDWGFIQDTMHLTAKQVGDYIGRSEGAVWQARTRLRRGHVPVRLPWTEDEEQYLRDTPGLTVEQVAQHMARTPVAIALRRKLLTAREGIQWGNANKSPTQIGSRRLLAQTCPKCGLLLDAYWFLKYKSGGQRGIWKRACRKCTSSPTTKEQGRKYPSNPREVVLQRMSQKHANRKGEQWTDADKRILADPNIGAFEKSLLTRRTYFATRQAATKFGYTSRPEIGDPKDSQWLIQLHPDVQRLLAAESGAIAA